MKICFINPRYSQNKWNGARVHITQLVKHLIARQHEVFAFPHYAREGIRSVGSSVVQKYHRLLEMDAFYVRVDGTPSPMPRFMRLPLRLCFRHVPIVWEVNATTELDSHNHPDSDRNERFLLFRQRARHVSLAICNTPGLAGYAADLGIARRVVVPLGSDPDVFRPDAPGGHEIPANPEGLNVVWCGDPQFAWNDFRSILAAARSLVTETRIRFFIILTNHTPLTDLPSNVKQLAGRSYAEMAGLFSRMDVGLCLYRKEDWTRYGTSVPVKLFDFMASGLVVVASPIGPVLECFAHKDAGYVVPFENVEVIAATLRDILANKKDQGAKRAAGRALVTEHYNWGRVADQTAAAIEALDSATFE